jgi:hypothetical protein
MLKLTLNSVANLFTSQNSFGTINKPYRRGIDNKSATTAVTDSASTHLSSHNKRARSPKQANHPHNVVASHHDDFSTADHSIPRLADHNPPGDRLPLPRIPTITFDILQPPYVSLHSITALGAQAPDPTTAPSPVSFASTHFWTHTYTAGGAHEPTLVTYVYQTANIRSALHHWT